MRSEKRSDRVNDKVGLGGGCHWCTEAVFEALRGVGRVEQGFIRAAPPHDAFSEAVVVHYDPGVIGLADLIEIHLSTHASTSQHALRTRYRSAVYVYSPQQAREATAILGELQQVFSKPLVTRVLGFAGFKSSDPKYAHYFGNNGGNQFCQRHIDPKLGRLRADYAHFAVSPPSD
ncbi:MAG: peptide-methionine (S)-S-oxide reductase [Sedimenticolaceae bacterium]